MNGKGINKWPKDISLLLFIPLQGYHQIAIQLAKPRNENPPQTPLKWLIIHDAGPSEIGNKQIQTMSMYREPCHCFTD